MGEDDILFILDTLNLYLNRTLHQSRENLFGVADEKVQAPWMNGACDQAGENDHVVSPFDNQFGDEQRVPRAVDELTEKEIVAHRFRLAFSIA